MIRIARWEAATHHNAPILRQIRSNTPFALESLYRPVTHQNRINLWSLSSGMLDMARYLNTAAHGKAGHVDMVSNGSVKEHEIYTELSAYIMVNYRQEMNRFRTEFRNATENFKDDDEIKAALYEVIMALPRKRIGSVSPFYLLRKATNKVLTADIANSQTQNRNLFLS